MTHHIFLDYFDLGYKRREVFRNLALNLLLQDIRLKLVDLLQILRQLRVPLVNALLGLFCLKG